MKPGLCAPLRELEGRAHPPDGARSHVASEPERARPRILVVDDDADVLASVSELLADEHDVDAARDGQAALMLAREGRHDLVIADAMVSGLDGVAITRALRDDPNLRDVPVLLLSERSGSEAIVEGLRAGADDYLVKPISPGELRGRVAARLRTARVRRDDRASLQEREEHLRAIVETTPECVKLVDRDGNLLQMNPSGLAMIGAASADAVVGKSVYALIAPEHRDGFRVFNERICDGGKGTFEFDIVGLSGARRHLETHAVPLRLRNGETVQLGVTRDITERRNAEQALRESDRRKDEFIATLSHELRNPLAAVRSGLHLLTLLGSHDDKTAHVHQVIERQMHHLVTLVDDLLEASRIQRGVIELRRERISVASIIEHAVETTEPLVRSAGHRLVRELPSEPLWVDGDLVRLAQVVSNLLANAARFTHCGGQITLSACERDGRACISVRDTGPGFAPEVASRLFEMFAKSNHSSGLGVGLALSRRLVEMHGGGIDARSDGEGSGAEVIVRLPLSPPPHSAPTVEPEPAPAADAPPRCRVLVADDNRDAAELLGELLTVLGAEVALAFDGEEAVARARAFEPNVALLDIGMPRLDGYEAARQIRAEVGTRRICIAALTGWGQPDDIQRSREAGFDQHLVKPATLDALRDLLASATRRAA